MRGQKRPTADRTRALGIAVVDGAAAASQQTGIPENTIRTWMETPEFVVLRERTKEAVTGEWWGFVQEAFRRSVRLLDETEDPVKAATTGAIIFDKMALASGDATSRTESRNISDDIPASVKRELRRRYAAIDSGGDDVAREGAEGATSTAG
jgi:hypothetical protein